MSKLSVYNAKGAAVGELELGDGLLVTDRGDQAVHDVVLAFDAAARAGTASTKTKGEVAGSNKKPWKQKGTGRARAGYRQSPVWRGGGVAFGPHPRSYAAKVNKKVGQLALRRILGDRAASGALKVVEALTLTERRTRQFVDLMKGLGVEAPALFVVDQVNDNVRVAARNLPGVEIVPAQQVHVQQLVRYPVVVVTRAGMGILEKRMTSGVKGGGMKHQVAVIRKIQVTEKATALAEKQNQYFFDVAPAANKRDIKQAVEALYKVNVTSVNTMRYIGKSRRERTPQFGKKADWKRAVVTLKTGDKIELS